MWRSGPSSACSSVPGSAARSSTQGSGGLVALVHPSATTSHTQSPTRRTMAEPVRRSGPMASASGYMPLKRSFTQPLTCRICGLGPKNNARALASPNMLPTSQAVVMPVKAFEPELTGVKWFAPWRNTIATGPVLWLKSPLPLRVEFALPHGARLSAVPHRMSDGLPERSWPLDVAVNVLSGSIGMVQSTRASRAAFTVPLPPCEWPAVQTKSPPATGLPCATVMPWTICEPVPVLPEVLATTMIPYDAHWLSRPLYEMGEPPVPLPQVRIGEPTGRPTGRNS